MPVTIIPDVTLGTMNLKHARAVAGLFALPEPVEAADFPLKGNINRAAYLISAGAPPGRRDYILQQLNPGVFKRPETVMEGMIACLDAQRNAVDAGLLPPGAHWEVPRLIPTKDGRNYLKLAGEDGVRCWRMMTRIGESQSCKSLQEAADPAARLRMAAEAGRGLALFGALTSGMDASRLRRTLPGYRDTPLYYAQLDSVLHGSRTLSDAAPFLPADPGARESTQEHFLVRAEEQAFRLRLADPRVRRSICLALEYRSFAQTLCRALESGNLKTVTVHGDPKLENFLFDSRTGGVKSLVDLDTVMPHTWLSDWGDMARSLVNQAGETETDLGRVGADPEIFRAAAGGFLAAARHVPGGEAALMADAVGIMALELGVRFLADYLRGDTYFRLEPADPRDKNKTRALVQFRLFEDVQSRLGELRRIVEGLLRENRERECAASAVRQH